MSQRLELLEKKQEGPARESAIAAALAAGKVVPQSVRDLPLELMTKVIADLPAGTVPLSPETPGHVQAHSATAPTGVAAEIRANLGITDEAWKRHNPPDGKSVVV